MTGGECTSRRVLLALFPNVPVPIVPLFQREGSAGFPKNTDSLASAFRGWLRHQYDVALLYLFTPSFFVRDVDRFDPAILEIADLIASDELSAEARGR